MQRMSADSDCSLKGGMNLIKRVICLGIMLISYTGCTDSDWAEPFPSRASITICDSIGVETGDSSMTFGSISDAQVSPTGTILVLDQAACCMREYSSEGEFLQSLSRKGNGPGEMLFPTEFTVMQNGNIIVRDKGKLALIVLDENGNCISEFTDWTSFFPPEAIVAVDSDYFAGYELRMIEEGSDYMVVLEPALYSVDDAAINTEYYSDSMLIVVEEMASSLNGMQGIASMASDTGERVFYSRSSDEVYEVQCWDADGNLRFSFSLDIPQVEKTTQETQAEIEYARIRIAAFGGVLPEGFEPDPYHTLVEGIGIDSNGNLWIQRGTERHPVFDVVNSEGEHIGTAEYPRSGYLWRFSITPYGSLAWNLDPESGVQRVYILDMQEDIQN